MLVDLGDGYGLRKATADDHDALKTICLKTGDAGSDATQNEDDPDLLGLIYAVPYQVLEPDFAFLIEGPAGPAGYVLGAPDTDAFNARLARQWYPTLQRRHRDPGPDKSKWRGSDWARRLIHHPDLDNPASLAPFPAHGHIDLLASAQGRGIGRKAMGFIERLLGEAGAGGMHLGVALSNVRAQAFYRAVGFARHEADDVSSRAVIMVKRLDRGGPTAA